MSSSSKPFVQPGEPLNDFLRSFWQRQIDAAEQETPDYRHPPLPLARIKKVMKSDPEVKVSPILFCKACEIFIAEITARAFIIADSNKRRTLSRADIAKALSKSDQFDFLIDIVPREEPPGGAVQGVNAAGRAQKKGLALGAVNAVSTSHRSHEPLSQSHGEQTSQSREDSGNGTLESAEGGAQDVTSAVDLEQLQSLLQPPGGIEPRPHS
ncbi:histone-fold-containing protein [Dichomitus squalens]|uniref:Histone-fold-containing protein n=2 Tax=Dichomitus squalens TaxID=114155 RepID=A0A4Q9PTQ1_9APHY|nr:histone-fold-containing protein [Dichomitus squalens LYAD-421 SS1]EJF60008.1 histone-fold-containing protein [Dichomitus squalens LYAD-421 SS1]TBU48748.1 histone-fold-containing protein [Dichomitus squalens]TBU57800.1 histone-fold-containing protein [Dichomitus squalens]